ncbi:MAG TPA: SH3 domain-containing protein [Geminicoccaceae bacterium]
MTKQLPTCLIDPMRDAARAASDGASARQPQPRFARSPLCSGPLLVAVLLWAALLAMSPAGAARDPVGVEAAIGEVRGAIEAIENRVDRLSRQTQLGIGAEVHVLAQSVASQLSHLERHPVAAAAAGIEQELLFLHDLMRAVGAELDRVGTRGDRRREAEVRRLAGAVEERVAAIGRAVERRADGFAGAVVTVEQTDDGALVRMVDRTVHDGVRFAAIGLLLVGLLVIGLRLLALSEAEIAVVDLIRQTPVLAIGGLLAVAMFLFASATVAVDPSLVAGLAERTELRPAAGACERLAVQREQLLDARAIEHDGLGDAVKDRMRPVAQDCLGLESQVAAVEAVEWLAANLDPLEAGAPVRSAEAHAVEAEIERLMSTARPLEEATGEAGEPVAPEAPGLATGGPVEELEEEQEVVEDDASSARQAVTTTRVNYRAGPGTDARRLGTLPEGARVVLLGEDGSWSNIQLEDGRSVYVASAYVRADS